MKQIQSKLLTNGSLDPMQLSTPNTGACFAWIRASRKMSLESNCKFRNWAPNAKTIATEGMKSWPLNYLKFTPGSRHYLG